MQSVTNLMLSSGAGWVLWLLLVLSFAMVTISIERFWVFRKIELPINELVPELRQHLRTPELAGARAYLEHRPCAASQVVIAGLEEADRGAAAAEEAMAAALGLIRRRLEHRLLFLGTLGNNAPFIGLLGTVIGIVRAFEELGRPSAVAGAAQALSVVAPERVMSTIAEALVATAVGILVAIPSVAAYNYFQGRIAAVVADSETLGHVLLARLRAKASSEGARG